MRGPEHRIPAQPAQVLVMSMVQGGRTYGKCRAACGRQHPDRELNLKQSFQNLSVCPGGYCIRPMSSASSGILSYAVKPSNERRIVAHYVRTQYVWLLQFRRWRLPVAATDSATPLSAFCRPLLSETARRLMCASSHDLACSDDDLTYRVCRRMTKISATKGQNVGS